MADIEKIAKFSKEELEKIFRKWGSETSNPFEIALSLLRLPTNKAIEIIDNLPTNCASNVKSELSCLLTKVQSIFQELGKRIDLGG